MQFPILRLKLKRYARKQKISLPVDYVYRLSMYQKLSSQVGCRIVLSWSFNLSGKINAGANVPRCIVLNRAWVKQIVWNDSSDVYIAFKATIGHELTHKEGDFRILTIFKNSRKFVSYVNEAHADFGGTLKMLDGNRETALQVIRYKQSINEPLQKKSPSKTHPSWQQRYDYIANYNFNEELIRRIAKDIDFDDETLIRKISDHFEEIYLN